MNKNLLSMLFLYGLGIFLCGYSIYLIVNYGFYRGMFILVAGAFCVRLGTVFRHIYFAEAGIYDKNNNDEYPSDDNDDINT